MTGGTHGTSRSSSTSPSRPASRSRASPSGQIGKSHAMSSSVSRRLAWRRFRSSARASAVLTIASPKACASPSRSAWQSSPSFLGILGHRHWVEGGDGSDALDELTGDCFEFIFVRRHESLKRQAERKPTIDGVVYLAVRHFLLEAQKNHDPMGFRVFEILRDVVGLAVEGEQLWVILGDPKIRNETHLAQTPKTPPEAVRGVDLSELVGRWSSEHLDGLVNASHGALKELLQTLVGELVAFLNPTRPGFRFGDVAGPLKRQARWSWAARFANLPELIVASEGAPDPALEAEQLEQQKRHLQTQLRSAHQGTEELEREIETVSSRDIGSVTTPCPLLTAISARNSRHSRGIGGSCARGKQGKERNSVLHSTQK